MAYEMNDLIRILFLVFVAISTVACTNINCNGKAFHCINSTHFMICVDLGGGVSTTIDDFMIPCPPTTVCHEHNIFECEFPKIEVPSPPLQVISVNKQSDTSETLTVNVSETTTHAPGEVISVFNDTIYTAVAEEVTTLPKMEVLEDLIQRTGPNSENTTEKNITSQVNSNSTDSVNETIDINIELNNTVTTSSPDTILNTAVEISVDKTVTASLSDKSIDTVTSIIGLIDLISTDLQTLQSTELPANIVTSLDTLYDKNVTTIKQNITDQITRYDSTSENITNTETTPLENIPSGRSVNTDEVNTPTLLNPYIQNILKNNVNQTNDNNKTENTNQTYSGYQSLGQRNMVDEVSTTQQVPDYNTNHLDTVDVDFFSESVTTEKQYIPTTLFDMIAIDTQSISSLKSFYSSSTPFTDNLATTIDDSTIKKGTIFEEANNSALPLQITYSEKPFLMDEVSAISISKTYKESFKKDNINNSVEDNNEKTLSNHTLVKVNFTGELTEQVTETNTNHVALDKTDNITEYVKFGVSPLGDAQRLVNENLSPNIITFNTLHDNTVNIIDKYTNVEQEIATEEISTTSPSFYKDDQGLTSKRFLEKHKLIDLINKTEQLPMIEDSFQPKTEKSIITLSTDDIFDINFLVEQTTIAQPLDITLNTEKELIDNAASENPATNKSLLETKNETIEKRTEAASNIPSTVMLNDNGALSKFVTPSTIKYPIEELTTEISQNEFTTHVIEVVNEVSAKTISSVDVTYETTDSLLVAETSIVEKKVRVEPSTSQPHILMNKPPKNLLVAIAHNISGIPILDNGTTENVIVDYQNTKNRNTSGYLLVAETSNFGKKNTVESSTSQPYILRNEPTENILTVNAHNPPSRTIFDHGAIKNVLRSYQDDKTENVFDEPINIDTVSLLENLNANQWIKTVQEKPNKATYDPEGSVTTLYPPGISETPSISDGTNDFGVVPEEIQLQLDSAMTTTLIAVTTPPSINTVKFLEPQMAAGNSGVTAYRTEISTQSLLEETQTINIEDVPDFVVTTLHSQVLTSPNVDITKEINDYFIATKAVSSFVPASEEKAGNETLGFNDIDHIDAIHSIVDTNGIINKTANMDNKDKSASTLPHKEVENIKITSTFDIANSSVIPNRILQTSISDSNLSYDYIKTIKLQHSDSVKTTTDYIPAYRFTRVESSEPEQHEDLTKMVTSSPHKYVTDPVSPSHAELFSKEGNTEDVKYLINTATPSFIISEQLNTIKPKIDYMTEKPIENSLSKQTITFNLFATPMEATTKTSISDVTAGTAVSTGTLGINPIKDESTTIVNTGYIMSSTQIIPQLKIEPIINSELSPLLTNETTKIIETQTVNYEITEPLLLLLGSPDVKMSTEPTLKTYTMGQSILPPVDNLNNDIFPKIKSQDLLQNMMAMTSEVTNTDYKTKIEKTTEAFIDTATDPDSMVETIEVIGDKTIGTYRDMISMKLNETAKPIKNKIDHESIVVGLIVNNKTNIKTNVKSIDKEDNAKYSENDYVNLNIDNVKMYDSIENVSITKATVVKNPENKTIPFDLPSVAQADGKASLTVNAAKHHVGPTNTSERTQIGSNLPHHLTPSKEMSPEYENMTVDNTSNANIKIIQKQDQVRADSENMTDKYTTTNTKTNISMSYRNLSLHNSTFNDDLQQHLISLNHTITTEVQSHLNESDKQSHKTNDELKLNATILISTNIKLNNCSSAKRTIKASTSPFDCSNRTRGKYADKNDCRKFYTCIGNLKPTVGTCPNNTVFSEINKQCTRNLSHCVRNNQFHCLLEGRFSDFFKDNIYYICAKKSVNTFIRYTLQCQADYHLNKVSIKCEKNAESSALSASSASENSKIRNDESTPNIESNDSKTITSTTDFECEDDGNYPFEKDCRKYYECTKIKDAYRLNIKKCASDEVYDKKKKKCVESDSSEC